MAVRIEQVAAGMALGRGTPADRASSSGRGGKPWRARVVAVEEPRAPVCAVIWNAAQDGSGETSRDEQLYRLGLARLD
jgi:hypothetical protein